MMYIHEYSQTDSALIAIENKKPPDNCSKTERTIMRVIKDDISATPYKDYEPPETDCAL